MTVKKIKLFVFPMLCFVLILELFFLPSSLYSANTERDSRELGLQANAGCLIETWVARYDGIANDKDVPQAITVDDAGNVYVTGASWDDFTQFDITTVKYDSDGNQLWIACYDGPIIILIYISIEIDRSS